jgi:hypothetical protein
MGLVVETNPCRGGHIAMTANRKRETSVVSIEGLFGQNRDVLKELLRESLQDALAEVYV